MRRKLSLLVLLFSLIGALAAFLATRRYFEIVQSGFAEKSFCTISAFVDCDTPFASKHAHIRNIPVALFGFLYFLIQALLALGCLRGREEEKARSIATFGWGLALAGTVFSAWKAWILHVDLQLFCILCTAGQLSSLFTLLSWHFVLKGGWTPWRRLAWRPYGTKLLAALLVLFLLGGIWGHARYEKAAPSITAEIPLEDLLHFHFLGRWTPLPDRWGAPKPAGVPVIVTEFSDFQCPYCQRAAFMLKPLLLEFGSKIRFVFRHYPLDRSCNPHIQWEAHDQACLAAFAAVCAEKRRDFESYHDDIFHSQKKLGRELFLELARRRGWDIAAFEACLADPETKARVLSDIELGQKVFVEGTPTVFVNGRLVKYWSDREFFRALLREEIRRAGNRSR